MDRAGSRHIRPLPKLECPPSLATFTLTLEIKKSDNNRARATRRYAFTPNQVDPDIDDFLFVIVPKLTTVVRVKFPATVIS